MIDVHCHILPGLDDGALDIHEAFAMARILVTYGFGEVFCTPHCLPGYFDNTPERVVGAVQKLQQQLGENGIFLSLWPGMEYHLDELFYLELDHLQPLGETKMVLAEIPSRAQADVVFANLKSILEQGFVPLIAHPERSPFLFQGDPWFRRLFRKAFSGIQAGSPVSKGTRLMTLRDMGCLFQGNIGSFCGHYGSDVQRRAQICLELGLYDHFGTDGHHSDSLEKNLQNGLISLNEQKRVVG